MYYWEENMCKQRVQPSKSSNGFVVNSQYLLINYPDQNDRRKKMCFAFSQLFFYKNAKLETCDLQQIDKDKGKKIRYTI